MNLTSPSVVALLALSTLSAQSIPDAPKVIDTYCSTCHNGVMRSPAGPLLDKLDSKHIGEDAEMWADAYRQIQAGTMPPVGAPRPARAVYDATLQSIEKAMGVSDQPASSAASQDIATRLATLLWNTAPDAELSADAANNRLTDRATLERHVRRMLADDRAQAFVSRFFFAWFRFENLHKTDPDPKLFPDFDLSLRDAMEKETELFLLSQLREDRDPVEIWSAPYTFLNGPLAKHYGIANVNGRRSSVCPLHLSAPACWDKPVS